MPAVTPSIRIDDVVVNEAAHAAVFRVYLSVPWYQNISVDFSTGDGSAMAGTDYNSVFGKLTFAPGVTEMYITVPIIDDLISEATEKFTVNLSGASNASISDSQATAYIQDNDNTPKPNVGNATVNEGGLMVHTVTLSAASSVPVVYTFSLAGNTATAGADFSTSAIFSNGVTLSDGHITVPAGVTSFSVSYATMDDALVETNETTVLSICQMSGSGTIIDNDVLPSLSISDVRVNEAEGVSVFTVTLSAASGQPVTVSYDTGNGTAIAGSDYASVAGTVTFAAGETTKTVTVPILNDAVSEADETFTVNLKTPCNATIADAQGVGTIVDNDKTLPFITINDITVKEPGPNTGFSTGQFTVRLSEPSTETVTVHYKSKQGTARAGDDYASVEGTVVFQPGQTKATIEVKIKGDAQFELAETFTINLSTACNAIIKDDVGVCTIPRNDSTPPNTVHYENPQSPIVLDLNNDGVRSVGRDAGVNFDLLDSGAARNVGWVNANDGLLVRDINRNGQIDNGSELFGQGTSDGQGGKTADGFQALAMLDSNQDGAVNKLDLGWSELQVWRDADTDGVTDEGELLSLETAGVLSLNLGHTVSDKVENGNLHLLLGDYTTSSGETREMTDVFFAVGGRTATEAVALHGQAATATGLTFDPTASVWHVGAEDGNVLIKGFDAQHDVLDLRDLLPGAQGDNLDGLLSIKKEGSSTVIEVKDAAGADHAIVFAGVDLLGGNSDQQVIHDLLNNHLVVVD